MKYNLIMPNGLLLGMIDKEAKDENLILLAIGWLAREGKISLLDTHHKDIIVKTQK